MKRTPFEELEWILKDDRFGFGATIYCCPKCGTEITRIPTEHIHYKNTYERLKEKFVHCTMCGAEFNWDLLINEIGRE